MSKIDNVRAAAKAAREKGSSKAEIFKARMAEGRAKAAAEKENADKKIAKSK